MRYRINTPHVIQESIEGEVIIVHLLSGYYYSLEGSAASIWSGVVRGISAEEIGEEMVRAWDGDPTTIRDSVAQFLERLVEGNLIVPDQGGTAGGQALADEAIVLAAGAPRRAFVQPMLHRYEDMQELLLIDPIHEVEATGWPETKQESSGPRRDDASE